MLDLLKGVQIISFNHFLMGPLGIQILADMGADVICIEATTGGFQRRFGGAKTYIDGDGCSFHLAGRNKRNIALNLKHPIGVKIARDLIFRADVVAENFRPGVMDRLGLGYNTLKASQPDLIYAAATGFGATGPGAERPGQDLLIQALSGLAMISGTRSSGPRPVGVSIADHHGAALYALGIVGALFRRQRTGTGCFVDVDLMSAAIDLQTESLVSYLNGSYRESLLSPEYIGGWYNGAPYGLYPTKDGFIVISHCDLSQLADGLDVPVLKNYLDKDLFEHREPVAQLIAEKTRTAATAELIEKLGSLGIWCAPVNDYETVVADTQVRHNHNFISSKSAEGTPVTLVNHPVRYDGSHAEMHIPPQPLGAQSVQILEELGWDNAAIEELVEGGIVFAAAPGCGREDV
jgi:crotonobetainyl-CoA:carnitine CoA-transferase CaiB-like acyl-CoA transferase